MANIFERSRRPRVAKCIAAVPSFRRTIISVRIKINAIDLRKFYHAGCVQSFCRALEQGVRVVVTAANNNGCFFLGNKQLD